MKIKISEKYCHSVSGDSEETLKKHCYLSSVTISLQLLNVVLPVICDFHVQNSVNFHNSQ